MFHAAATPGAMISSQSLRLPLRRTFHATAFIQRRRLVPKTPSVEEAVLNILHNNPTPPPPQDGIRLILSCLARNEPGVISRVADILQSKSFNIESLVAAHTTTPGLSRMTVALNGDENQIQQAKSELEELEPMWAVLDYTHTRLVERELLLMRVSTAGPEAYQSRYEEWEEDDNYEQDNDLISASKKLRETSAHLRALTELTGLFGGRLLDVASDSVIIELCSKPHRISSFVKLCKPFGIIEASRTGKTNGCCIMIRG